MSNLYHFSPSVRTKRGQSKKNLGKMMYFAWHYRGIHIDYSSQLSYKIDCFGSFMFKIKIVIPFPDWPPFSMVSVTT